MTRCGEKFPMEMITDRVPSGIGRKYFGIASGDSGPAEAGINVVSSSLSPDLPGSVLRYRRVDGMRSR
jgi:hypothetical protein